MSEQEQEIIEAFNLDAQLQGGVMYRDEPLNHCPVCGHTRNTENDNICRNCYARNIGSGRTPLKWINGKRPKPKEETAQA